MRFRLGFQIHRVASGALRGSRPEIASLGGGPDQWRQATAEEQPPVSNEDGAFSEVRQYRVGLTRFENGLRRVAAQRAGHIAGNPGGGGLDRAQRRWEAVPVRDGHDVADPEDARSSGHRTATAFDMPGVELSQGERMWIEPRGFEEVHSRGNTQAHRLRDPSKWVPFGVGAIEGTSSAAIPVLESGEPAGNGTKPMYGPGDEPRPCEGEPTASAHGELL